MKFGKNTQKSLAKLLWNVSYASINLLSTDIENINASH